jgi:hypothetical protein
MIQHLNFTAKPYYSKLIACIDQICKDNHVDQTHGLAHAKKIG